MSKQNIYNSGHNWTQKAAETEGSSSRPPAERIRIGGPDGININFFKTFFTVFIIFYCFFVDFFILLTAVGTSQLCVYRVKIEEKNTQVTKK